MNEQADVIMEIQPGNSGVRGNLDYRLIIMRQVDRCGLTLAKLPHEIVMPNLNEPVGCTYQDIKNSFYDGVRLLEALITPYIDTAYTDLRKQQIEDYRQIEKKEEADLHNFYFGRYAAVISLCARLGLLLEPIADEGV